MVQLLRALLHRVTSLTVLSISHARTLQFTKKSSHPNLICVLFCSQEKEIEGSEHVQAC